jgi:predicted HicB family RNase H-like nuclease
MGKTRGKTSTASKTKYNEYSYSRYTIRIRKDTILHDDVEEFMTKNGTSLNYLVNKLLDEHFFHRRYSDPEFPQ